MTDDKPVDYYEILQVSSSAEPETIQRIFRMLAQRYHPDNKDTGDERRFREIQEAYTVLTDAEKRARYDIGYEQRRNNRWRLVTSGSGFRAARFERSAVHSRAPSWPLGSRVSNATRVPSGETRGAYTEAGSRPTTVRVPSRPMSVRS